MSIAVSVDTSDVPVVNIVITTPDGSSMTSVVLERTSGGITAYTRVQPAPGLPNRFISDYEADWDAPLVYTAIVTYSGTTSTYTSDPIVLPSVNAWAIHPTQPNLSICIDSQDGSVMGVSSIGDVTRVGTATSHNVIRSRFPVVTSYGPRLSPSVSITITTVTAAEETAMNAILDDQTPLLVRFPQSWGVNWEDGFYAVLGDVTAARALQYVGDAYRTFTLPLTRVASPAGAQQSTWDYDGIKTFADYAALTAAYADYASLTANQRN